MAEIKIYKYPVTPFFFVILKQSMKNIKKLKRGLNQRNIKSTEARPLFTEFCKKVFCLGSQVY